MRNPSKKMERNKLINIRCFCKRERMIKKEKKTWNENEWRKKMGTYLTNNNEVPLKKRERVIEKKRKENNKEGKTATETLKHIWFSLTEKERS